MTCILPEIIALIQEKEDTGLSYSKTVKEPSIMGHFICGRSKGKRRMINVSTLVSTRCYASRSSFNLSVSHQLLTYKDPKVFIGQ
jgi:hypothetical protein